MMTGTYPPCLFIHGFTGGPYEVEPLARYLSRAGRECRVFTLPGHDQPDLKGLDSVHWLDWIKASAEEAIEMESRYESFDVVGFSMGGLLAAYLANRYKVRRLVLLNAAVIYVSPRRFIREMAVRIRSKDWNGLEKAKKTPLRATLQFIKLAQTLRPEFRRVTVPTYVAQGENDPIVHPRSAYYIYDRLSGEKELHLYPQSKHMICLDVEADKLFRSVESFLSKVTPI
jgi:esterase/lipase